MNRKDFRKYRKYFVAKFQKMLDSAPTGAFDEQGLPSYCHANPLAALLFWERIYIVLGELAKIRPQLTLDFGCGSGVILPALINMKSNVFAYDLDLMAAKYLAEKNGESNINFVDDEAELKKLNSNTFDMILCLDVLEHVKLLNTYLCEFSRLLKPNGNIIVSGPTESLIYKIGRYASGFTGEYHFSNIYDIERHLTKIFKLKKMKRLAWPFTLFRISYWTTK